MKQNKSLIITFLLMIIASASVIINLIIFESILNIFIVYHIIICLLIPFLDLIFIKKLSIKESLRYLGLLSKKTKQGIIAGFLHGLLLLLIIIGGFLIWGNIFLADNNVIGSISQWGIPNEKIVLMIIFMVLFNGGAEELFWRGYIHQRMKILKIRWLAIGLIAFFYTTYHIYTIPHYIGNLSISLFFIILIFCVGCLWGWLREYFKSVWTAIIGHMCVTIAYIIIYLFFILKITI